MNRHWSVKLSDVAEVERAGISPSDITEGTIYVGLEHIAPGGGELSSATVDAGELASTKFRFTADHILYGKLRPYLAKIVAPDFAGVCSTDILPIRSGPQIEKRYLLHFLRLPENVAWAAGRATGVNLPRLSPTELGELAIPLPPLDEQRRIAAILDKADALRQKRKRAIALLDSLTQSIFLEMFGDPVANPKGWKQSLFGNVGRLDRGVSRHRPRDDPRLLGGNHPLIQTGDVARSGGYISKFTSTYSDFGLAQSKKWPVGTLCITIAANIANTGILEFESCFPDSVVGYTCDSTGMIEYVRVWMGFLRETIERSAPTVAQKNINLEILRALPISIPPSNLLADFGNRLAAIKAQKA